MQLGFIGLGAMGAPMAANLLASGHQLAAYARRKEAVEALVGAGAVACRSPREVAEASDVVFTMVTDTRAVEAVVLGDAGMPGQAIIDGAKPGTVVIDHSTIAPSATRKIAETLGARGIHLLDAPVSGGVAGARAHTLSIMVGGEEEVFERCHELLTALGTTIVYMGPSGAGQVAKACNQICIVVNQLGVAEALLVAERSGLDPERLRKVLMGGFAASRILEIQAPKMAARRFEGAIASRLHHKDALLALDLGRDLGVSLPATALAADALTKLQEAGGGNLDSAAVFTVIQRSSQAKK